MSQAFVIVLREGFEAFLIVSIIFSYLRRINETWLLPAVRWGIAVSILASVALGLLLEKSANEPLWEGILGIVAAVFVTTLVIQMWRQGRFIKQKMESRLSRFASGPSRAWAWAGVFLFTVLMISREGMETALMLIQVPEGKIFAGVSLGLVAVAAFCLLWIKCSSLVDLRIFFQVTGLFLLLFVAQVLLYSFHELTEAGVLPNAEAFHEATEPFAPDGLYGRWFSPVTILVCTAWLLWAWAKEKFSRLA